MSDQFLAEIRIMPFNFAPKGWAACDGQLMSIQQNQALFSLLGTQYGGDGNTNFALPNLQGSVPMDFGNGTGLTPRTIGEVGGEASLTLTQAQLPVHSHTLIGDSSTAITTSPQNTLLATPNVNPRLSHQLYTSGTARGVNMLSNNLPSVGGGHPHNNLMPYLTLNFVIALLGIFPARS